MGQARLYCPDHLSAKSQVTLAATKVKHLLARRIYKLDTQCILFNERDGNFLAAISQLDKKEVLFTILEKQADPNVGASQMVLAPALISNNNFDLIIQKAVELGAKQLFPVQTKRSAVWHQDRATHKISHWHEIVISATEQCGRIDLMEITSPLSLEALCEQTRSLTRFVGMPGMGEGAPNDLSAEEFLILVGPEGGFEDQETSLLDDERFRRFTIGSHVLRAETAAIASLGYFYGLLAAL